MSDALRSTGSLAADPLAGWEDVVRPTLVVDRRKAERNIRRMADKAAASGVRFRPHFKTHNSAQVGELFRAVGTTAITVSSVDWARAFADAGWDDITIAFPVNIRALAEIRRLARDIHLGILVDSLEAAATLRAVEHPLDVWIDVDTGYGRTGIRWDDGGHLRAVADAVAVAPHRLRGVLTHSGHSYHAGSREAILAIYDETAARLDSARRVVAETTSIAGLEISIGDTPTCSAVPRFDGVDEIRAGNFVYFDLQQLALGSCTADDLALTVACPVVGVYPERGEIVIQGGKVHLSADTAPGPDGAPCYGGLARVGSTSWEVLPTTAAHVRSVSQEHGVIRCAPEVLREFHVGDLAFVVPTHACMPSNLIAELRFLDAR